MIIFGQKKPRKIEEMTVFEVSLAHQPRNNETFVLVKDKEEYRMKKLLAFLASQGADVPEIVKKELGDAPKSLTFDEVKTMLKDAGVKVDEMIESIIKDAGAVVFDESKQMLIAKDSVVVDTTNFHYVAKDRFDVVEKKNVIELPEETKKLLKDQADKIAALEKASLLTKLSDKVGAASAETLLKFADSLGDSGITAITDLLIAKDKLITDLGGEKGVIKKDVPDSKVRDTKIAEIMEKDGCDKITAMRLLAERGEFYTTED